MVDGELWDRDEIVLEPLNRSTIRFCCAPFVRSDAAVIASRAR